MLNSNPSGRRHGVEGVRAPIRLMQSQTTIPSPRRHRTIQRSHRLSDADMEERRHSRVVQGELETSWQWLELINPKGLPAPIVGATVENAILFLSYGQIQRAFRYSSGKDASTGISIAEKVAAGAGAGAITSFFLCVNIFYLLI